MLEHTNIIALAWGLALNPMLIAVGIGFGLALRRPSAALWAAGVVLVAALGLWAVMGGIGYAFSGADGEANAPSGAFWRDGAIYGFTGGAVSAVYAWITQLVAIRLGRGASDQPRDNSKEREAS